MLNLALVVGLPRNGRTDLIGVQRGFAGNRSVVPESSGPAIVVGQQQD